MVSDASQNLRMILVIIEAATVYGRLHAAKGGRKQETGAGHKGCLLEGSRRRPSYNIMLLDYRTWNRIE